MFKKIWFSDTARTTFFSRYMQSSCSENVPFMVRRPFETLVIDLRGGEDMILSNCAQTCRNEVRRGIKEGILTSVGAPSLEDVDFFNFYMKKKSIGLFNQKYLTDKNSILTKAFKDDVLLAAHLYYVCKTAKRARLIYSALADANTSKIDSVNMPMHRFIGIANRVLHFEDIKQFKMRGLFWYDFGGIGSDESNPKIKGINEFKRSFGGESKLEFNYSPLALELIEKIRKKYHDFKA